MKTTKFMINYVIYLSGCMGISDNCMDSDFIIIQSIQLLIMIFDLIFDDEKKN